MSKTTKIQPPIYASTGAVRQHDGSLPVYLCNECQGEVVWATSTRTGRKYLANVGRGQKDQRFYVAASVHKHEARMTVADYHIEDDEYDNNAEAAYDDWANAHYRLEELSSDEQSAEMLASFRSRYGLDRRPETMTREEADELIRNAYIAF